MSEKKVFVRKSSGLVREFATRDAFMWNALTMGILTGAIWMVSTSLYAFPNANLVLGIALTAIWGLAMWVVYVLLVTAMPRTGGDYIYESRILNSAVGFIFPMGAFIVWCIYWVIFSGITFADFGINPFLTTIALRTESQSLLNLADWFMSSNGAVITALILLFLAAAGLILPVRHYVKMQWVLMGSAIVSLIAIIGVLLSVDHNTFVANFNAWVQQFGATGNYYQYVIDTAKAQGFNPNPGFSWYDTLGVLPVTWFLLAWAFWSVAQASEVKNAENVKQQFYMIAGAGLFTALVWIIMAVVTVQVVGQEFVGSLAFLSSDHPDLLVTNISPYTSLFATIARPGFDVVLTFVLLIGILCSSYQINYNTLFVPVRYMLAGSFDRVYPESLSEVHPKYHTPVKAVITATVIGVILIGIWRFVPGLENASPAGSFAQQAPLLLTCLAGALFPYLKKTKAAYEASPGSKYKVAGIPLITICGALGIALILLIIGYWVTEPRLGLANPSALTFVVGVYAFFAIYYYVAKAYRKRQGIDISQAYDELPPA